jgi:hypothetical protein
MTVRGIAFSSGVAPGGVTDLSRHIALNGTSYGFSITGGRLNAVVPGAASFVVNVNAVDVLTVAGSMITAQGATSLSIGGALTVTGASTLTGAATAPTPSAADNSTNIATTAWTRTYAAPAAGSSNITTVGTITTGTWNATAVAIAYGGTGATSAAAALTNLGAAPIASPTFTGVPAAPTPATADNTTALATTAFVKAQGYAVAASYLPLTGGTLSGLLTANGGIVVGATANLSFGSTLAASPTDLSKHIALFGTTFGLSITSARLNIVSGNQVYMNLGGNDLAYFNSVGLMVGYNTLSNPLIGINGAAGSSRYIQFYTAASPRWRITGGSGAAEGGSNAGSDFLLNGYDDTGVTLGTILQITRSTGNAQWNFGLTLPAAVTGADLTKHIQLGSGYGMNLTASALNLVAASVIQLTATATAVSIPNALTVSGATTVSSLAVHYGTMTGTAGTIAATDCAVLLTPTATFTLTLPAATAGRQLWLTLRAAFAVNSASANVVAITGGAAATAIMPATTGKWVMLVADGTNWQTMAGN